MLNPLHGHVADTRECCMQQPAQGRRAAALAVELCLSILTSTRATLLGMAGVWGPQRANSPSLPLLTRPALTHCTLPMPRPRSRPVPGLLRARRQRPPTRSRSPLAQHVLGRRVPVRTCARAACARAACASACVRAPRALSGWNRTLVGGCGEHERIEAAEVERLDGRRAKRCRRVRRVGRRLCMAADGARAARSRRACVLRRRWRVHIHCHGDRGPRRGAGGGGRSLAAGRNPRERRHRRALLAADADALVLADGASTAHGALRALAAVDADRAAAAILAARAHAAVVADGATAARPACGTAAHVLADGTTHALLWWCAIARRVRRVGRGGCGRRGRGARVVRRTAELRLRGRVGTGRSSRQLRRRRTDRLRVRAVRRRRVHDRALVGTRTL
mmetsp:Transcript_2260/g.6747  ORF Transcript_2260/g.6747 Transcript_2260/m.6747 type:complete len:393 (+) Transcript_2260:214-1392(+)